MGRGVVDSVHLWLGLDLVTINQVSIKKYLGLCCSLSIAELVLSLWRLLLREKLIIFSYYYQPCLANDLPLPFSLYQACYHITLDQNLILGPPAHCKDLNKGEVCSNNVIL